MLQCRCRCRECRNNFGYHLWFKDVFRHVFFCFSDATCTNRHAEITCHAPQKSHGACVLALPIAGAPASVGAPRTKRVAAWRIGSANSRATNKTRQHATTTRHLSDNITLIICHNTHWIHPNGRALFTNGTPWLNIIRRSFFAQCFVFHAVLTRARRRHRTRIYPQIYPNYPQTNRICPQATRTYPQICLRIPQTYPQDTP